MMKLLAIDTSGPVCGVAVLAEQAVARCGYPLRTI